MLPYQMIGGGTFSVSVTGGVAAAVNVELVGQFPPDYIVAKALTAGANQVMLKLSNGGGKEVWAMDLQMVFCKLPKPLLLRFLL